MKRTCIFFTLVFLAVACRPVSTELPLLRIGDNKHYIITEEGKPFFWLGGTAWELFHRLDKKEALIYLKDRADKGFTVIQAVVLAELDGLNTPNAYGDRPLINNDPAKINEAYFNHVDFIIEEAEKLGIYIGLLPTWGDKFVESWGKGPLIFTVLNAEEYGYILGKRYLNQKNIIWILGGDRKPVVEKDYEIIRAMARGIKKAGCEQLISYHTQGGTIASDWFQNEEWLDIDMFQSGHIRGVKEFQFTRRARMREPFRPVIDGEPCYEDIPDWLNLEKGKGEWLDDADVRRAAYWNMFAGAAGFTYGCNDIWQMYSFKYAPQIKARTSWNEAIHLPGSFQVGYMKKLFESFPWQEFKNNQSIIKNNNPEDSAYVMSMISGRKDVILVYSPCGRNIQLDLSGITHSKNALVYWFNPRDNENLFIGEYPTNKIADFHPHTAGRGGDMVLVAISDKTNYQLP